MRLDTNEELPSGIPKWPRVKKRAEKKGPKENWAEVLHQNLSKRLLAQEKNGKEGKEPTKRSAQENS